ncbi:hypothetical protein EUGRSUZ_J00927, partial [Eucalyptus grandis]
SSLSLGPEEDRTRLLPPYDRREQRKTLGRKPPDLRRAFAPPFAGTGTGALIRSRPDALEPGSELVSGRGIDSTPRRSGGGGGGGGEEGGGDMYKNQLQELAQRSCFNLPSYACIREGPDHAPRFKAVVNFNGESFESPSYCSTLRQAEHSAAEVALHSLATRGPSHSLASRILDETGVYKNLLQEIAQRVGAPLPHYSTFRSGLGHLPVFTGTVELAGIIFTGVPAKTKKQAEKNAAMAAWSSLKQLSKETASTSSEPENNDELEQITIARALQNYRLKEKVALANSPSGTIPFAKKFQIQI